MTDKPTRGQGGGKWLAHRTVVGTGITSALGDFCYETTTVILPLPCRARYSSGRARHHGRHSRRGGGLHQDDLRLLRREAWPSQASGSDRLWPDALGQALIAIAAGWPLLLLGRIVSWFGEGLRGPLREAIVIQAVSRETRGRAFGFHRAADTVGVVLDALLGVDPGAARSSPPISRTSRSGKPGSTRKRASPSWSLAWRWRQRSRPVGDG